MRGQMKSHYQINDDERLILSEDALSAFRANIQAEGRKEAGGILLGRFYPTDYVMIEKVTIPGRLDKSGLFFFDRSRKRAQKIVIKQWKDSSGISIYLGEWHTHPVPDPVPSSRDRQMIRNMFNQTQMEITFLFLIIIGTRSNWVGIEDGNTLRQLQSVSVVGQHSKDISTDQVQCLTAAQVESN